MNFIVGATALTSVFAFIFLASSEEMQWLFIVVPIALVLQVVLGMAAQEGKLSRRKAWALSFVIIILMGAIPKGWIAYKRHIEQKYVVSTREYIELWTPYWWQNSDRWRQDMDARGVPENHPERRNLQEGRNPFTMTEPVALGESPAFVISDRHPRLDGATSLETLYRSFVDAVYLNIDDPDSLLLCSRTPYAYENLINGRVDMVFAFRPSAKQIAAAAEKGVSLDITPIGYDAFIFFVNAANPVNGLTSAQIRGIYSGAIDNWRRVGGESRGIEAFQRVEGSGSQSRMLDFMGETELMSPRKENLHIMMRDIVANARYYNYRGAIGYSFLFFVDNMMLEKGVKLLAVDGVPPSLETVGLGAYPLREEICVVTAGSDNPNLWPFKEWMLSPQGQKLVKKIGYSPVTPAKEGGDSP